jgi:hypothetical protein
MMNIPTMLMRSTLRRMIVAFAFIVASAAPAAAQWSTTYEQFYLPGSFNWAFRNTYPAADRLFNAFDYGHAILYERLYTKPGAPVSILEQNEYDFITKKLLTNPPHVPLEEAAIEVAYAKIAPEAKAMFDWAHLLHRQIYDVWSDERLTPAQKDVKVAELIRYYKTRPDLAFSSVPKSMDLMEGQYYSTTFRKNYPKFNGLIWAYHWLQIGLYEPLLTGKTQADRQTGIVAAVARFWQMLENPPNGMPRIMPMTAAVSPTFAARYPEAAIIFDNLHSMHDVVSDILASPKVPQSKKREEILKAASRYRDRTSFAMTPAEWREMAEMMGVQNMGGPAVGFLPELPTATVERGSTAMSNMAGMSGVTHGSSAGASSTSTAGAMAGMDHSKMNMPSGAASAPSSMPGMDTSGSRASGMKMSAMDASMQPMMDLHKKMMDDPVIRRRMIANPEMRRMMTNMMNSMPADHRAMMQRLLSENATPSRASRSAAPRKSSSKSATAKKKTTTKKATAKKPVKKDPMAEMDHSKMKM